MKGNSKSIIPQSLQLNKSYTIKSVGVWLCLWALLTGMDVSSGNPYLAQKAIANAILSICCSLGTHLVRMLIRSEPNAPWKSITIRAFLLGVPLFALMMSVLHLELASFLYPEYLALSHVPPITTLIGLWFFMSTLFAGWTGAYVSNLAIKKNSEAMEERLRLENALREAELRALKAQINPHFFFNSLNTIRALVNERPERAQEAILHLSQLLRATLQNERQLRSLREELETTKHYLALEKLRFEERLKVHLDLSNDCLEILIPTMLLQTLVENALKHGISKKVEGGELHISATPTTNGCLILVTNPGNLDNDGEGTGLGLKNARMRLSRLLGEAASLQLSQEGATVVARLNIPIKRND